MVEFLRALAAKRWPWALLATTALLLEFCALFFQHVMGLHPCVMCIYERLALLGILAAGLLGVANPQNTWIRWSALSLWGFSSFQGLLLAVRHTDYQLNPSPFNQCSPFADFPSWMPLDQWVPWLFFPDGDCSEKSWELFSLSMPQWLIGIFGAYLLVFIVVAVGNLVNGRRLQ